MIVTILICVMYVVFTACSMSVDDEENVKHATPKPFQYTLF